jgi:hypothetical protein
MEKQPRRKAGMNYEGRRSKVKCPASNLHRPNTALMSPIQRINLSRIASASSAACPNAVLWLSESKSIDIHSAQEYCAYALPVPAEGAALFSFSFHLRSRACL